MEEQNIKSTFSDKSDIVLSNIMKRNNLEGRPIEFLLTKITMLFSRSEISEKEMVNSIQKEINVSKKVAERIVTEIKDTLIPTLWNKLSQKERESLLHTKKLEEVVPEKTPISSDNKNNFNSEPPKKSAPSVNKKSDGPDKYKEPIE